MNGKGDSPRPLSVTHDQFAERWKRAFKPWDEVLKEHAEGDGPHAEWARGVLNARCTEPGCADGINGEDSRGRPAACPTCNGKGKVAA